MQDINFLIDIGNVLLPFNYQKAVDELFSKCLVEKELADISNMQLAHKKLEKGLLNWEEFFKITQKELQYQGDFNHFSLAWSEIFWENSAMFNLLKIAMQHGHEVVLFSNISKYHKKYLFKKYNKINNFKKRILSYQVGSIKPEKEIYQFALDKFKLIPNKTIYVDDLEQNIQMGNNFGFNSFQYSYKYHNDFINFLKNELNLDFFKILTNEKSKY